MSASAILQDLPAYLENLVAEQGIPAISVSVWHDDRLYQAASGILNVDTEVRATIDSVFQIGSISKVFTASLLMLLVDERKVDLDKPVKHYLPDFHVADPKATEEITVRHLLSHTSGLVNDFSHSQQATDEESSIARCVDRYFLLPQVHTQVGKRFSYSNAGYVIAGRVIEVVSGTSWHKAVEDHIFKPLKMTQSLARPTEVLRFRAAMGHVLSGDARNRKIAVHKRCYLPLELAPTGSVLTMSATDLLKFGKAHLNRGKSEAGEQWLSESSTRVMQEAQIGLPSSGVLSEDSWGIGWMLGGCQGIRMFGHGGGTTGQQALLEIIPDAQFVLSLQTNGVRGAGSAAVSQKVLADMLHEIVGVKPKNVLAARVQPADVSRFTGSFGAAGFVFDIVERDGALFGSMGGFTTPSELFTLKYVADSQFAAYTTDGEQMLDFTFLEPDDSGRPRYLFFGCRLWGRM